jgi:ABC-type glycerol-3-phosphate transport system permease component
MAVAQRSVPRGTRSLGRVVVYAILLAGTTVTLVPFIWMLLTSLKPASEIVRIPPTFFPERWTLQSYRTIFDDPRLPLARFYFNSLFVSGSRVLITLFTSSLAGYLRQIHILGQARSLRLYPGTADGALPGRDDSGLPDPG